MRPRTVRLLLLLAVVAVALAIVAELPGRPRMEAGGRSPPNAGIDLRMQEIRAELDRASAKIVRVDDLASRIGKIEGRVAALCNSAREAPNGSERARVLEDLYRGAKVLSADPNQRAQALEAWALVAENASDSQRQAEAWFEQAELSDQEMAAELLARVIETVGLDCKVGQDAALLLGFCQHGNISESLRIWSVLVTVPSLSKDVAVRTRKMVADMLVTHGEYDAAIREYERFAADYRADEDPKVRTLAEVALQTADNVRRQMKGD